MNPSTPSPSLATALRATASASLQAIRQMGVAVSGATSIIGAAVTEKRGVARSACLAVEQTARAGIKITRDYEATSVAVWRGLPLIGAASAWSIGVWARVTVALFSLVVGVMIAGDVLLNTAAEWRTLHPRVR